VFFIVVTVTKLNLQSIQYLMIIIKGVNGRVANETYDAETETSE